MPGEPAEQGTQPFGQLAMVISEVFGVPVPGGPLAGQATVLEGLQAGVAQQLAPLDDPGLTGTGILGRRPGRYLMA